MLLYDFPLARHNIYAIRLWHDVAYLCCEIAVKQQRTKHFVTDWSCDYVSDYSRHGVGVVVSDGRR